jgi:hypothetical protein
MALYQFLFVNRRRPKVGIKRGLMFDMKRLMTLCFENNHIWRFCVSFKGT